jgi:hypothetical protein
MKKRRGVLYIVIGLGAAIGCCVILISFWPSLIPCAACKAEKEIGARYGLEGDVKVEMISDYFDQRIVIGQTQEEVFAFFRKGSPNAIHPYGTLGNVRDIPNASCYFVKYDDMLGGNLLLNRYVCFDGNHKLIYIVKALDLF